MLKKATLLSLLMLVFSSTAFSADFSSANDEFGMKCDRPVISATSVGTTVPFSFICRNTTKQTFGFYEIFHKCVSGNCKAAHITAVGCNVKIPPKDKGGYCLVTGTFTATAPGSYIIDFDDKYGSEGHKDIFCDSPERCLHSINVTGTPQPQWQTTNGPQGGLVTTIISGASGKDNVTDLYLNGNAGIFKSSDGGDSWIYSSKGLNVLQAPNTLTFDSKNNLFYVAEGFSQLTIGQPTDIYISSDFTQTWTPITPPYPGHVETVLSLVVDNNGLLYAGSDSDGLYSWDGTTWTSLSSLSFPNTAQITSMVLDPTTNILYMGLESGLPTIDGFNQSVWSWDGTTFAPVANPTLTFNHIITDVTLDHSSPTSILYASTKSTNGLVYYLDNNNTGNCTGQSLAAPCWLQVGSDIFTIVNTLFFDSTNTLNAGTVFSVYSFNAGVWSQVDPNFTSNTLSLFENSSQQLLAGTGTQGIYKLTAGVFTPSNTGLNNTNVLTVAIDKNNNVYASTLTEKITAVKSSSAVPVEEGVFQYNGTSWTSINTGLPADLGGPYAALLAADLHTSGPNVLYAGLRNGVFFWNGSVWSELGGALTSPGSVSSITVDENSSVYVGTEPKPTNVSGVWVYNALSGLWFNFTYNGFINSINDTSISSVAVDSNENLYAADLHSTVYQYDPVNIQWNPLDTNLTAPVGLALDSNNNLYVVGNLGVNPNQGVFKLVGGNWTSINSPKESNYYSIGIDKNDNIYAGISTTGLQSEIIMCKAPCTASSTWVNMSTGLPGSIVSSIAFDLNNQPYAGTGAPNGSDQTIKSGAGVYTLK